MLILVDQGEEEDYIQHASHYLQLVLRHRLASRIRRQLVLSEQ